jgi:hypothetical protein
VVEYSREDQRRTADELERLPTDSMIERMLADYAVTRDQLRRCN